MIFPSGPRSSRGDVVVSGRAETDVRLGSAADVRDIEQLGREAGGGGAAEDQGVGRRVGQAVGAGPAGAGCAAEDPAVGVKETVPPERTCWLDTDANPTRTSPLGRTASEPTLLDRAVPVSNTDWPLTPKLWSICPLLKNRATPTSCRVPFPPTFPATTMLPTLSSRERGGDVFPAEVQRQHAGEGVAGRGLGSPNAGKQHAGEGIAERQIGIPVAGQCTRALIVPSPPAARSSPVGLCTTIVLSRLGFGPGEEKRSTPRPRLPKRRRTRRPCSAGGTTALVEIEADRRSVELPASMILPSRCMHRRPWPLPPPKSTTRVNFPATPSDSSPTEVSRIEPSSSERRDRTGAAANAVFLTPLTVACVRPRRRSSRRLGRRRRGRRHPPRPEIRHDLAVAAQSAATARS